MPTAGGRGDDIADTPRGKKEKATDAPIHQANGAPMGKKTQNKGRQAVTTTRDKRTAPER